MAVNAFGHFLAINQLYPLIRKTSQMANTPAPRIVFESSEMHRFAPSNVHFGSLEEINDETIDPTQLYGRTKVGWALRIQLSRSDVPSIKACHDSLHQSDP